MSSKYLGNLIKKNMSNDASNCNVDAALIRRSRTRLKTSSGG